MGEGEPAVAASPLRTIGLLSAAQAVLGSSQTVLTAVTALTAATLVSERGLSTLPVSLMILVTALATGPAVTLLHRLGRRRGFMLGASLVIPGAGLAALAAYLGQFWPFALGIALLGIPAAFTNQLRFAAADSVPDAMKARAISWVLAGGLVSGFAGPWISVWSKDLFAGHPFVGTYLILGLLAAVAIAILSRTRLPAAHEATAERRAGGRTIGQLLRSPEIILPMVIAAVSYALMVLVMVAAPITMVYVCGYTTEDAAFAIQWHLVAMFAPSFVTGAVIQRIGAPLTAGIGLVAIIAAAIVNVAGISQLHFTIALALVGLGWNFGFIASTAMLAAAYRPEEAARVQALNEQVVFGVMALASLASGLLLDTVGWATLNVLCVTLATAGVLALGWSQLRDGK